MKPWICTNDPCKPGECERCAHADEPVAYLCTHATAYYGKPRRRLQFHPPTEPGWSAEPLYRKDEP